MQSPSEAAATEGGGLNQMHRIVRWKSVVKALKSQEMVGPMGIEKNVYVPTVARAMKGNERVMYLVADAGTVHLKFPLQGGTERLK